MSQTIRKTLREELSARFIPALRERGFNGPDRISGNGLLHEFRRSRGGVVHVLSLQFDKDQRLRPRCAGAAAREAGSELTARGGSVSSVSGRPVSRRPPRRPLAGSRRSHWWDVQASSEHIRTWPTTYRSPHGSGRA